ncbi:MAG: BACON domain-containing protein [Bacteroidales bacterium]|nr:BACON domain-containing protein [Bacteroidales bacterium]
MKNKLPLFLLAIVLLPVLCGCPNPPEPDDPDILEPIQATYDIGADGGEFTISVKTNTTLSVQSNVSWISVPSKTKAATVQTVKLVAEANGSTDERTGKVTVSGGSLSASITIVQAGKQKSEDPYINIGQTTYTIDSDGGSLDINITSNVAYTVSSDQSWAKPAGARVQVDPNPAKEERSANITYSYGDISKSVQIVQTGEDDVLSNAGKSTYNVPYTGGEIEVKVSSNVDYTVTPSADWITQVKTRTVTTDILTFTVAANDGAARQASIDIVFGETLSFSVTVNQNAYVAPSTDDPYLEVSPNVVNVDEFGGEVTVTVNANYEYMVDCDEDWITIKQTGETFICSIAPNEDDADRSAMLIFSSQGLVAYLAINQLAHGSNIDPFDVGSNLSVNGTANCYIVPKAGKYSFDASVMGNGPQGFLWTDEEAVSQFLWPTELVSVSFTNYGSEKPNQASVLWDDNNVITDVSIDSDLQVSFTATGNKGNAVIIVKNKQMELLWSWHIWCTDSPARLYHESIDGTRIVMLDRNLGAVSANPSDGTATFGYWYQFGRKDPLKLYYGVASSMVEGDQSMKASVLNPTTIYKFVGKDTEWFNGSVTTITADLWGNPYALHNGSDHMYPAAMSELRKTIYDPCPPGYMVPPEWAWDSFSMDNCTVGDGGLTFTVENGDAFYPFAGFGDQGDEYGGDNGWYGYPGYTPNRSSDNKYHHNMRNVVCCWSSGSEHAYLSTNHTWDYGNYHRVNQFAYMQHEEASDNFVCVNENSKGFLYNKYAHVRQRCCSVRCMKMQ